MSVTINNNKINRASQLEQPQQQQQHRANQRHSVFEEIKKMERLSGDKNLNKCDEEVYYYEDSDDSFDE